MPDFATESAVDLEQQFGLLPGVLGTVLIGMFAKMPVGLCIQDPATGRYLFVNAGMADMFGLAQAQIIDRLDCEWLDAAQSGQLRAGEQFAASRSEVQVQTVSLSVDGVNRRFTVTRQSLERQDAAAPCLLCSTWVEGSGKPREAARPAAAEGSPGAMAVGQSLFDEQFRRELDLSNREHREFALISLAVDAYKPELAQHGELASQRVEQLLAGLLRGNIRAMDSSFRVDANRFVLLLSGVGLATAHSRVEALRRQCASEPVVIDGEVCHFTVSIGVASYPHTTREREALLQAADRALGQAQRRGGNHVALASIRFESR